MKNKNGNWSRKALMWSVLLVIVIFVSGLAGKIFPASGTADPETYCPMGGLQALTTYFVRGSLPCSMSTLQIVMGIVLAAAVILFSKLFCGYLCPVGTVQDLMARLRRRIGLKALSIRNGSAADRILRIVKYVLLFWIFYMTATASELFCKNLDPYYAVATGFKGEITLWMSVVTVVLVVVAGFFIDNFWCKYVCPLGAVSNSLKFWEGMAVTFGIYLLANVLGAGLNWAHLLGALCLVGYILEIFIRRPQLQLLHVVRDEKACNGCGLCEKACPWHIKLSEFDGRVTCVDCTLCGECVAACNRDALQVGINKKVKGGFWNHIPAILAVFLTGLAMWLGTRPSFEIPTINETWGIEMMGKDSTLVQLVDPSTLETMEVTGLKSVKCFGSSTAFKNKLMGIKGVHGVKTYVVHHRALITYDPAKTSPDAIQEEIFVPVRVKTDKHPELVATDSIKVYTIRTENMFDRMDFTYLGLQMRNTDLPIYGLESEFACPLIVRVFTAPDAEISADDLREIVERKELVTHNPTTGEVIKSIPVDFEFVKMEDEISYVTVEEFVKTMFNGFESDVFNGRYTDAGGKEYVQKRDITYAGEPQFIYEIADSNFEKPVFKRANAFQFLSNHISKEEGIIEMGVRINSELVPAIQIRFAAPMTADKLWNLITEDPWTITYSREDVREQPAKIKFKDEEGNPVCTPVVKPYVAAE